MEWMSATAAKSRWRRQTKGRISRRKASPAARSAATGPRLDHGGAFPVLPHALVIDDARRDRDGERRRRRVRPQPQVGAENIALGRAFLQQPHEVASDSHIDGTGPIGMVGCHRGVIEHHEVHIGRIVQFAPAELAHAEHDEAGIAPDEARVGPRRAGKPDLAPRRGVAQQMRAGGVDGGLGEVRQRPGHAVERPQPGDVADRGGQRALPLGLAQQGGDRGARRLGVDARQRVERAVHRVIRPAFGQQHQRRRFAHREVGEIGAVPAQRLQQRPAGGRGGEVALGGAAFGETLPRHGGGGRVEGAGQAFGREAGLHGRAGNR